MFSCFQRLIFCTGEFKANTNIVQKTLWQYYINILFKVFIGMCSYIEFCYRYESQSTFLITNQALHVLFVFLPVLWTCGFLPPVDCFFLWMGEQIHVYLLGGSPMASDLRYNREGGKGENSYLSVTGHVDKVILDSATLDNVYGFNDFLLINSSYSYPYY